MLEFGRPGFLLAGAVAALIPLLLHLIARRPAERLPLPTARFLRPDARTTIRLRRRPADLFLLLLRALLLLLLGAAFAAPEWLPQTKGTASIVLLDGSATAADGWNERVATARKLLLPGGDPAAGALVVFDTAAMVIPPRLLSPAFFDSLASSTPSRAQPDYGAALGAIPSAAREAPGADSLRVALVSDLRWSGWRAGLAHIRRAAWPARIALPEQTGGFLSSAPGVERDSAPAPVRRNAVVIAGAGQGRYVAAALGATGWSVRMAEPGEPLPRDPATLYVVLSPLTPTAAADLLSRARDSATVLTTGAAGASLGDALPWRTLPGQAPNGDELFFSPELTLGGAVGASPGRPTSGARILAVDGGGRVAAVAAPLGGGCLVHLVAELEGGTLPLSDRYPAALARLAHGCDADPPGDIGMGTLPLDAGARAVLAGTGPEMLPASQLAGRPAGIPLGRWALAAALAVALLESWLAYGPRRSQ